MTYTTVYGERYTVVSVPVTTCVTSTAAVHGLKTVGIGAFFFLSLSTFRRTKTISYYYVFVVVFHAPRVRFLFFAEISSVYISSSSPSILFATTRARVDEEKTKTLFATHNTCASDTEDETRRSFTENISFDYRKECDTSFVSCLFWSAIRV